jgi:sulfotransferase
MPLHFISGLPRSGSTLLAAILRQNPRVRAGMSSPLAPLFRAMRASMDETAEFSWQISDQQRERVLRAAIEAFYSDCPSGTLIIDTSRGWCSLLPALQRVLPTAKVICCVRNLAWILDSFERIVQANGLRVSKSFVGSGQDRPDTPDNTVERVESLMRRQVGMSLNALKQAWFSEYADRLIAVRYESLVGAPGKVIASLYQHLAEEPFDHNFDQVTYESPGATLFDEGLGMPSLHRIRPRVEAIKRETILPPDLFAQYNRSFWDMPGQNPRGIPIL